MRPPERCAGGHQLGGKERMSKKYLYYFSEGNKAFGGVQLCQSSGAGLFRNRIRHEKISLPTKARSGRETEKATGKLLPVRPSIPAAESFVPTK